MTKQDEHVAVEVDATTAEVLAAQAKELASEVRSQTQSTEPIAPVGWQAPLLDLAAAIAGRAGLVALIVFLGVLIGVAQLWLTKPFYRASSVILLLPREKPNLDVSVSTGTLETGLDSAKRATTGALMLPPDPDLYSTLLVSESTLRTVATKFEARLLSASEVVEDDRSEEIVEKLRRMLRIVATDEGMMTVHVTSTDSQLAADMANEFAAEMERASKSIERQLILQQSGFLGEAQKRVERELVYEEEALRAFFSRHGIVDMPAQASGMLLMIREQKQQLKAIEHELMVRKTDWTENDEHVRTLRSRIQKTRSDIEGMQRSYLGALSQRDYGQVQIEFDGLTERVNYKRDLLATIATQRAVFDIRAEQPAASVAVLRYAVRADRAAGPSKRVLLGVPFALSIVLSLALVVLLRQWSRSETDPYLQLRKAELREQLGSSWLGGFLRSVSAPLRWLRPGGANQSA